MSSDVLNDMSNDVFNDMSNDMSNDLSMHTIKVGADASGATIRNLTRTCADQDVYDSTVYKDTLGGSAPWWISLAPNTDSVTIDSSTMVVGDKAIIHPASHPARRRYHPFLHPAIHPAPSQPSFHPAVHPFIVFACAFLRL